MIAHLLMPLFFVLRLSGYAVGVTPWHAGAASVLMQVQWLIVAKL